MSVAATGFRAGGRVDAVFRSDPVNLGSATADESGRVQMELRIPSNAASGTHSITLTGPNPQGGTHTATGTIQVVRSLTQLPQTGSSTRNGLLLAFWLVTAGELLIAGDLLWARRRVS